MFHTFSQGPKIQVTLEFESGKFKRASLCLAKRFECCVVGNGQIDPLLAFLESYGQKKPIPIELDLEPLSSFRKKALISLQKVPFGEVLTYGELAANIGHPNAARAIGSACHHNPYPLFIPCHRVIASGNRLGGFAMDLRIKSELLRFEEGLS